MRNFVRMPHLPQKANALILGEKYAEILQKYLEKHDIRPIFVPSNPSVDKRLSGHADLSVFHAEGEKIFLAPYLRESAFAEIIRDIGGEISFIEVKQNQNYPNDAQLNAAVIGKHLIYSPKVISSEIVNFLTFRGGQLIPVRQAYAKCNICVVDANSIITADRGIAKAAEAAGLQVLLITEGYVDLPGFPYGFIGGASFRLSTHAMAFTGVLDSHPDKAKILAFLNSRDMEPIYLTDRRIFDIGSAFPITEA